MNPILEVGVGGIFALMVIKEVFGFIKSKNGQAPATRQDIRKIEQSSYCGFTRDRDDIRDLLREIARNTKKTQP